MQGFLQMCSAVSLCGGRRALDEVDHGVGSLRPERPAWAIATAREQSPFSKAHAANRAKKRAARGASRLV
jgi:hypothetical protein